MLLYWSLFRGLKDEPLVRFFDALLLKEVMSNPSPIILIVDDERFIRRSTELALKSEGYHSISAGTGEEAIRLHAENSDTIQCVILDQNLPDMDGQDVHDALSRRSPALNFIFCSGCISEDLPANYFDDPRRMFISKPFRLQVLLDAVQGQLTLGA